MLPLPFTSTMDWTLLTACCCSQLDCYFNHFPLPNLFLPGFPPALFSPRFLLGLETNLCLYPLSRACLASRQPGVGPKSALLARLFLAAGEEGAHGERRSFKAIVD